MKKYSFKIYTLGCKVNQYDSRVFKNFLSQNCFIEKEKDLDLVVVNTCTVTKSAVNKDKRMLKKAKKENPRAKIVVIGCWPEVKREEVENIEDIDLIWGTGDLKDLFGEVLKIFKKEEKRNLTKKYLAPEDRSRYFIKVQDGCEQFCSYCIIPYTRGKLESRGVNEILKEIREASELGFEEVVFSGIHLGLYGVDMRENTKINLLYLLKKIVKIDKIKKIRLSSIEIIDLSDDLINFISENKKMCHHLHIPLQSGNDFILEKMNRPYTIKFFKDRVDLIRSKMPDIAITTDVIVGFSGETKREFKKSLKFIKEINFSKVHVFPFSAHPKTPAYNFKNQVEEKEKKKRSKILRDLSLELENSFKKKFKGRELDVLIENFKDNIFLGKSQYYFNVKFKKKDILDVTLNKDSRLIGRLVKIKY